MLYLWVKVFNTNINVVPEINTDRLLSCLNANFMVGNRLSPLRVNLSVHLYKTIMLDIFDSLIFFIDITLFHIYMVKDMLTFLFSCTNAHNSYCILTNALSSIHICMQLSDVLSHIGSHRISEICLALPSPDNGYFCMIPMK